MKNYHQFDVVVVGAGGAGLMAGFVRLEERQHCGIQQALSHALAYRCGPGRHRRGAGQYRGRSLRVAHL